MEDPFRPSPKTPKGKIVWREVKIALLARLAKHQTKTKETVTRLHQSGWSQFWESMLSNLAYNL